jgi:hypothetical protein
MTLSLMVLGFLGTFYITLGVVIVRRATKPSCRNCLYWHDCSLNAQLGRLGPGSERCATNRSEL